MTVTEINGFEHNELTLTLPDLPEEYLDINLIDNSDEEPEEISHLCPLAITDATVEKILSSKKLTHGDNVKETYLLELSTSFFSYKPGDTIGILTKNREEDIQKLFNHLRITHLSSKNCKISVKAPLKKNQYKPSFLDKVTTLNHLFINFIDIHSIPKKSLIRVFSEFAKDPNEKRQLQKLCSKEHSDLYVKCILDANQTFFDLIKTYPSCQPPVARLIENLPQLLPRSYSIASSPLASPNSVKIVFSVIETKNGEGLCTGMLKSLINSEEKMVKMFFRRCNGFNLPETNVPLILVGPGTGIAPFMGFLEHRKIEKRNGVVWLFYGCRYKKEDYLFKDELQEYLDGGVLTKLCVAFSRESNVDAKYVQDNIRKYGKELTQLIFDQNALVYICGDAKNMRKDIQNAFVEVFESHKGMTNKEANDCIKKLQKDKRYIQDIWI